MTIIWRAIRLGRAPSNSKKTRPPPPKLFAIQASLAEDLVRISPTICESLRFKTVYK